MHKQEMRKFKFVLPDNKKTNYTWNSQDTSVPEGKKTNYIWNSQDTSVSEGKALALPFNKVTWCLFVNL